MPNYPTAALILATLSFLLLPDPGGGTGHAQDAEFAKIKERELETVREQISALKKSMDKRAEDRDRISGELQSAEVLISEKRIHLNDLKRQRQFSEKQKAAIDADLATQQAALARESRLLDKWKSKPLRGCSRQGCYAYCED